MELVNSVIKILCKCFQNGTEIHTENSRGTDKESLATATHIHGKAKQWHHACCYYERHNLCDTVENSQTAQF